MMLPRTSLSLRTAAMSAVASLLGAPAAHAAGDPPMPPVVWQETTTVANGGWGRMTPLRGGQRWLSVTTGYRNSVRSSPDPPSTRSRPIEPP